MHCKRQKRGETCSRVALLQRVRTCCRLPPTRLDALFVQASLESVRVMLALNNTFSVVALIIAGHCAGTYQQTSFFEDNVPSTSTYAFLFCLCYITDECLR